jgi:hypothetical protein
MIETLRLADSQSCPECCRHSKPFVVKSTPTVKDGKKTWRVRCAWDDCGVEFDVSHGPDDD